MEYGEIDHSKSEIGGEMTSTRFLISVIKKYGLQQAATRDLGLFLIACVARGYTIQMTQQFGFSHEAIAVKGDQKAFVDYLNLHRLSQNMDNYLKNHQSMDLVFGPLFKEFKEFQRKTEESRALVSTDYYKALSLIIEFAPRYFSILGFYNAYWRYLDTLRKQVTETTLKRVSTERNVMASLYPQIEKTILSSVILLGTEQEFDGTLLTMMTPPEMIAFLKNRKLSSTMQRELKRRQKQYFYLYLEKGNKEYIITNTKEIKTIVETCFPEEKIGDINILRGQCGYPGKIRGKVYLLSSIRKEMDPGSILVAHSTHPNDSELIKMSKAIVAEEGGVLSHAAILAREMKKPCIIGTKHATKIFKDGDVIEIDANKGTVKKIK